MMKHMKKLIAAFPPCAATVQAAPKVPKNKIFYLQPRGDPMNSSTLYLYAFGV